MAIFVPGMPCALCREPIATEQPHTLFSPFVGNARDRLFKFSDATVHVACLDDDPLGELAKDMHDRAAVERGLKALCIGCRRSMVDPEDYFATGLLTSDPQNPLFQFNFIQAHSAHLRQWELFDRFRQAAHTCITPDQWDGPTLLFEPEVRWVRQKRNV